VDERETLALTPGGTGISAQAQIFFDPTAITGSTGEIAITGFLAIAAIAAIASFSSHYYALVQTRLDIEKAWGKLADALARRRAALEELLETAKFDDRFQPGAVSDTKRLLTATPPEGADAQRFLAEIRLSSAIGKVLATSQNYPSLARDPRYRKLEETLLDLEEEIDRRREIFNGQVALNNRHYANVFEHFMASLADVSTWERFPDDESEALADTVNRQASGAGAAGSLAELERYVSISGRRPASRAITTSIAMRSPTETSRPHR
jgi:LemA protein